MRTDPQARDYILECLQRGELRQGWGYDERFDLNLLAAKLDKHGWRVSALDSEERKVWRGNQRMWPGHWGRIKVGDVIVLPKLPIDRHWMIVRVAGDYIFDLNEKVGDYGHVLPVEVLVPDVANSNRRSDSDLVRSMRNRGRLWSLTRYAASVEELLTAAADGEVLGTADTDLERLKDVMSDAIRDMRNHMDKRFGGNQYEAPVGRLLERIYGAGAVNPTHGPSERGADFEITTVDPFGVTFTTVVQLKAYSGQIGAWNHDALDNIRDAVNHYGADAAVILTTADDETEEFRKAREDLEEELQVQIRLVAGDELAGLFLSNLSDLVTEDA
jgi:hypothetical protein